MKHDLKISRLAIICVLCTAVSGAYGASSVRSLGGAGTYSSASDAAAAAESTSGGSVASVRGGSVRVNPSSTVSGTSTTINAGTTTSGRVATTPRLSIGHYLGGGTSVSGGSSVRPITPGGSTSGGGSTGGGSTGGGDVSAGDLDALRGQVDQLERDIEDLRTADDTVNDTISDLEQNKQDTLIPTADGYIIIDESTNEIFVDVDALQGALETVAGKDGREVELGSNDTHLLWRYVGEGNGEWRELIAKADITGPQGEKGEKGDPGEAANLDAYSTTEQMNAAISAAIDGLATTYATKAELAEYAKTDALERGLAAKANAADVYTKAEVYNKTEVDDKVADIVAGDMDGALANKADKTYVDTQLATKADKAELANYATTESVTALDSEMDEVNATATEAALGAAQALSGLTGKEDTSNKTQTLTDSATQYPSGAAVTSALAGKANVDDVPTTVAELTDASNYVTTDGLSGAISTATENMVTDTELTEALDKKADKATTLAGYGITDAYTTAQIDEKLEDVAVGGMEGMEQVLAGKQDVANLVQVVSEADTTKYPSGAAVYKELETKANASELDTLEQTVGQLDSTINAEGTGLADQIDAANTAASAAQTAAEEAAQTAESVQVNLALKQDVSAREATTITNDETKYPSSAAVTAALAGKADTSALADYVKTDALPDAIGSALETAGAVTDENLAEKLDGYATDEELATKADASDVTELETAVGALETTVGDAESGLVKDVADAKAAADKASQDVAGKQDALTAEQLNAVNSGITAEKVSVYDGYADDIAGKQDALGYTAENAANKTDDMTADAGSTTKYPTVHAVEAYVTNTVAEGVEINTDQIAAGAVKTDQIGDGAVTEEKLSDELNAEIDGKEDKANLKALAYKDQIRDADVADDAAISKSKLATDVQSALDNAANAVAAPAGEKPANSVLGTDGDGNPVWYEVAM